MKKNKKYILASYRYQRTEGDYIGVIETLEEDNPNYEFCQFVGKSSAIMRYKNIRKEKLNKINEKY
jgi:hypothetical protein